MLHGCVAFPAAESHRREPATEVESRGETFAPNAPLATRALADRARARRRSPPQCDHGAPTEQASMPAAESTWQLCKHMFVSTVNQAGGLEQDSPSPDRLDLS